MQRIEVFTLTGGHATNAKIALRVNRKIRNLLSLGQTVLLDYERVQVVEDSFFTTVLHLNDLSRVKVCGLTPTIRAGLLDRGVEGAAATIVR